MSVGGDLVEFVVMVQLGYSRTDLSPHSAKQFTGSQQERGRTRLVAGRQNTSR